MKTGAIHMIWWLIGQENVEKEGIIGDAKGPGLDNYMDGIAIPWGWNAEQI